MVMTNLSSREKTWIILPAAGIGQRMQAAIPKQYLLIGQKPLIEHTVDRLTQLDNIAGILVMVSKEDRHPCLDLLRTRPKIHVAIGGASRAETVAKGLAFLAENLQQNDWVLVHDAARPCVRIADITRLRKAIALHSVGGILGVPVSDTVKVVSEETIQKTVDRSCLWQAQTPQVFRAGLLMDALEKGFSLNLPMTDEASAIEMAGFSPLIVEGHRDNIKVTRPEDLPIAEFIMQQQEIHL